MRSSAHERTLGYGPFGSDAGIRLRCMLASKLSQKEVSQGTCRSSKFRDTLVVPRSWNWMNDSYGDT